MDLKIKKSIYLVRGSKEETYSSFKNRILKLTKEFLKRETLKELKIVLTESAPPLISIIPFKKNKIAAISVKDENVTALTEIYRAVGFVGVFPVSEVVPVSYKKIWDDGFSTPGVGLLTLFNKKRDIKNETFLNIWHNSHTPISLEIHPLWNYNRNVVKAKRTDNIESWDGIVEEHFKTKSDLMNPIKFFGNVANMIPNMIKVYRDTKSFIDYKTIEPYLVKEYHLKSF